MSTFVWSDTHIGHVNMAEKWRTGPDFDGTVATHNAVIRDRWNSVVSPGDDVWIIGDAVMGQRQVGIDFYNTMHGTKHIVPGNHDHIHPMFTHKSADKAAAIHDMYAQAFTIHDPVVTGDDAWGIPGIIISHFPWAGTPDHDDADRDPKMYDWYPDPDAYMPGTVIVHGHTHSHQRFSRNAIHVGVDSWVTPVPVSMIADMVPHARAWI